MRPARILLALCVALLTSGAGAAEHTRDSLDEIREKLADEQAVLIDVREADEWDEGHLKDAELMPLSRLAKASERAKLVEKLPQDKPIYLHCKAGGRCLIAAELLKDEGFDLRPLKPGYKELLEAGFEKAEDERAATDVARLSAAESVRQVLETGGELGKKH